MGRSPYEIEETAEEVASISKEIANGDPFADLAAIRRKLGMPPVEANNGGTGTAAKLDFAGQTFYGINAHGQEITLTVNATSMGHAETQAFQGAKDSGATADFAVLTVDRDLCYSCSLRGAVKSMARQIGIKRLEVISPSGRQTIDTSSTEGLRFYPK